MALSPIEELLEIEAIKKLRICYSHYYDGGETDKLVDLALILKHPDHPEL